MCLLNFILTGFILFNYSVFCQLDIGDECVTLYNQEGVCVYEMDCPPIGEYLQKKINKSLSNYAVQYLLDSSCGVFNDKNYICCSNSHTATTTVAPEPITTKYESVSGEIFDVSNHHNLYLLPTNCGILPDNRVSGGQNTSINEFPFMALLRYETHQGLEFGCAGTIINERYILTSAKCVDGDRKLVSVRVGEHVISTSKDCEIYFGAETCAPPFEDIDIQWTVRLDLNYIIRNIENAVGLVRLNRAINLENSNMKAICLPINTETQYATLSRLETVGWRLTNSDTYSDILLKAILHVVDQDTCRRQYEPIPILDSNICARFDNKTDACLGEDGGPAFFMGRVHNTIRKVQYGILFAGHKTCDGDYPFTYTKLSYYMRWILDVMVP